MDLKSANIEAVLKHSGKLFHNLGPATVKAQSALHCKQDRGTNKRYRSLNLNDLDGLKVTIRSERYLGA